MRYNNYFYLSHNKTDAKEPGKIVLKSESHNECLPTVDIKSTLDLE